MKKGNFVIESRESQFWVHKKTPVETGAQILK
jgi:hypothetical protein